MNIVFFIWLLLGSLFFIGIIFGGVMIWWTRVFKHKFRIFENISGAGFEEIGIVRGRLLKIPGSLQEKIFWIPKIKEYVSAYGRKMGKNMYYLIKGQDGYYYNCVLGDFDAKAGMLDIEPVDRDVRGFHTQNAKNIKDRYEAPKNWPVILMSITIVVAILILVIGGYIIFNKINDGLKISSGTAATSQAVQETNLKLVVKLEEIVDKINSGGSGTLIDAPTEEGTEVV